MTAWSTGVAQRFIAEGFEFESWHDNVSMQQKQSIPKFGNHSVPFSFATTPTGKVYTRFTGKVVLNQNLLYVLVDNETNAVIEFVHLLGSCTTAAPLLLDL